MRYHQNLTRLAKIKHCQDPWKKKLVQLLWKTSGQCLLLLNICIYNPRIPLLGIHQKCPCMRPKRRARMFTVSLTITAPIWGLPKSCSGKRMKQGCIPTRGRLREGLTTVLIDMSGSHRTLKDRSRQLGTRHS